MMTCFECNVMIVHFELEHEISIKIKHEKFNPLSANDAFWRHN